MNTTDIVDNNDNNNKSFSLYPILARNKFTAELGKYPPLFQAQICKFEMETISKWRETKKSGGK